MLKTSKWLLLLLLFTLIGGDLTSCVALQTASGAATPDNPLRPTLSFLETAAARPQETSSPTAANPSVPQTGATENPLPPATELPPALTPPPQQPSFTPMGDDPVPQPAPIQTCPAEDSKMELSAPKTALKVGETIVVKIVIKNTGCVSLGMPQYRLAILNGEGKAIFSPDKPEPVTHYLAVAPGASDEVTFTLQAVHLGKATLSAMASFEVHMGYPGPAHWGTGGSNQLVIQVGE